MAQIELGDRVKDKVTGIVGIATQRIECLNGCVQYTVRQQCDKDGKVPESFCYDFEQLEIVEKDPNGLRGNRAANFVSTGGPESRPTKNAN